MAQVVGNGTAEPVAVEIPDKVARRGWHDRHGVGAGKSHDFVARAAYLHAYMDGNIISLFPNPSMSLLQVALRSAPQYQHRHQTLVCLNLR